jgi:hypothetical protein
MNAPDPAKAAAKLARQKRTVTIIACLLILGGAIILFAVKRMPLPMRIMVGLTDVVGGIVLLVLAQRHP